MICSFPTIPSKERLREITAWTGSFRICRMPPFGLTAVQNEKSRGTRWGLPWCTLPAAFLPGAAVEFHPGKASSVISQGCTHCLQGLTCTVPRVAIHIKYHVECLALGQSVSSLLLCPFPQIYSETLYCHSEVVKCQVHSTNL